MDDSQAKTLEESVAMAMDGPDTAILPFLPYILQDSWEIGSDPEEIINLVRQHARNYQTLKVLDLGCGKGAVSVRLAKAIQCTCLGIDGIQDFIAEAGRKAREYGVEQLCQFETGDIREKVHHLRGFDIIILGSVGPVLGNWRQTLNALEPCLAENGRVIIDDGYIEDDSSYTHPWVLKRNAVLQQIADSGLRLIDEKVLDKKTIADFGDLILEKMKKRCQELMAKHPDQAALFNDYIHRQEEQTAIFKQEVVCTTMVFEKKSAIQVPSHFH